MDCHAHYRSGVSWNQRFVFLAEEAQRAEYRIRCRLAQTAKACRSHKLTESFKLVEVLGLAAPRDDLVQQRANLHGADPSRDAFTTTLVHAEIHEKACELGHGRGAINDDQSPRTHD